MPAVLQSAELSSLIPASNTGRVSDVLCDAFIKTADSDDNFDIAKKLNISLNNAETQIQKAKRNILMQQKIF